MEMLRHLWVRDGRSAFEVLFLIAAVFTGLSGLVTTPTPTMGMIFHQYTTLWYGSVAIGGIVALMGVARPRPLDAGALIVERVGLAMLGAALGAYTITILVEFPIRAASVYLTVSFGVACVVRCLEITRDLRRLRKLIAEEDAESPPTGGAP